MRLRRGSARNCLNEILSTPAFTIWIMNRFGDLFIVMDDGTVHMLEAGGGTLEKVAESRDDFATKMDEGGNANQWLMIPLIDPHSNQGLAGRHASGPEGDQVRDCSKASRWQPQVFQVRRCRGATIAFLLASLVIVGRAATAVAPQPDGITRVTVHREGTALEIFADIARQGGVLLDWFGPNEGRRVRFDADGEPFWAAVHRACEAFDTHVMTERSSDRRLPIGKGAVPTRVVSNPDGPVTLIAQEPVAFVEQPHPDNEGAKPFVVIRLTACFDPAFAGAIAAHGGTADVEEAASDTGEELRRRFRPSIGAYSFPPACGLVMRIDTPMGRPPAGARRLARLRGTTCSSR